MREREGNGPVMSDRGPDHYALLPDALWDGESPSVSEGLAVVVQEGAIAEICPAGLLPTGTGRQRLYGCLLLPGLIDAHVHFTGMSGLLFLAAGVTTVRDTGNELDWILEQRAANAEDPARGPRILCCGHALDAEEGIWKHVVRRHATEEDLRSSIREHVRRGVDAIKLYASLEAPMVRAGVEEAHGQGMFALAHLNYTSAMEAAGAGLDEIEHFSRCDVAWREATEEEDDQLIDLFLEKGVVMNPTLNVWDRLGRVMEHSFSHDTRRKWVNPEYLDFWERFPYRRCEPGPRLRYQSLIPNLKRFLLRCHGRGVTIGAGTDTPFPNLIPGFCLHDELAQYVDAGISPVDALRAATSTNAKILGLEETIGRLQPGMSADMLAVEGNPLLRIDDLSNVKFVFRRGIRLDPDSLLKRAQKSFKEELDDPMTLDFREFVSGELPAYIQKNGERSRESLVRQGG